MRNRFGWAILLAAVAAGCTETGLLERPNGVKVVLAVSEALAGERIALLPHYLRGDRTRITLPDTTVDVGSAGTQQVPLDLDLTECLRDTQREQLGSGCPIRVAVVLRSAIGATVDSQLVGPIDLVPGRSATAPSVTLRRFGTLTIRPGRDTLAKGDTSTVRMTLKDRTGADLPAKPATWTTDAPTVVSVSGTGLATALGAGVATIRATLVADPTVAASVTIPVRGITAFGITPDSITMAVNDVVRPATTISAIGVSTAITWSSSSPTVASVGATTGSVTALAPGRAVVRAVTVADASVRDSVVILIAGIGSVSMTPDTAAVAVAGTLQMVTDVVALGGASNAVTYSTSAPSTASVNAAGLVTGVAPGTTLIRVQSVVDPTKRDSSLIRVFPKAPNGSACATATLVADTIRAARRFTKAQSPYRFPVSVVVTGPAVLTVDPGVVVCADPGVTLTFQRGGGLSARGTAAEPVRFTATDQAGRWAGFRFSEPPAGDTSFVTNAIVEWGDQPGLNVWSGTHPVAFDSVRFRQWSRAAVALQRGRISRSTVDTTTGGTAAVYLGQGVKFEATTVREAPEFGVIAADNAVLLGGRIEGTRIGLTNLSGAAPPAQYSAIRITGNRGRPAQLDPNWVAKVAPDSITQRSYLGNADDAIATEGTLIADTIRVYGHLGLVVTGLEVKDKGLLLARPGARILMEPSQFFDSGGFIAFYNGGRLEARGSFASPVLFSTTDPANTFDAISFFGSESGGAFKPNSADTSRMTNTIVERGGNVGSVIRISTAGLPVLIDSSIVRLSVGNGIQVGYRVGPNFDLHAGSGDRGAVIVRTRVESSGGSFSPGVELWATARMSNSVIRNNAGAGLAIFRGTVDSVTISGNVGDGIQIQTLDTLVGPFTVIRSNILGNGPFSVTNSTGTPVSIGNNYWGPFGANIFGPADATPQLASPIGIVTPFPAPPALSQSQAAGAGAPAASSRRPSWPYPRGWFARNRPGRR